MTDKRTIGHFKGCLLGGALGDALGAPVERMTLDEIRRAFGSSGVTEFHPIYERRGAITDDTQMTLFTTEGLILSQVRRDYQENNGVVTAVYHALLRWLYTQDTSKQHQLIRTFGSCSIVDGILTGYHELFSNRGPGKTCLTALRSGQMGTMTHPINDRKGCGGLMRIAPVGLAYEDAEKAFDLAAQCAAITHGHPTGYLSAGFLAALISIIGTGQSLETAITLSTDILKGYAGHGECLNAIDQARSLAASAQPSPETIETMGEGWVAEETLAISLYCALIHGNDFRKGVLLAVNHSGDSDSTGAVFGQISGAMIGLQALPEDLLMDLELKEVIEEMAEDLFERFTPQTS